MTVASAIGVVAVGAGLVACSDGQAAQGGGGAVPVKIASADPSSVDEYSDYIATIRSRRSVEIRPQVEGYVARILVKPGEKVTESTQLLQIDPKRQQATTNSAIAASGIAAAEVERGKATFSQLEAVRAGRAAGLKLAEEEHRRTLELRKSNVVSQQAEDQSTAQLDTARAELASVDRQLAAQRAGVSSAERSLQQTQAALQAQSVELQYYRITAPFTGTIGDVPIKVGDLVTPSTLLTTVDDLDTSLEAWVSVPVEDSLRLRAGLDARVLDATGSVVDQGKVAFVSPRIDPATQSILVKVELEAKEHVLRAQQFLRARLVWASAPGVRVPVTSIARLNGQTFLFVVKEPAKQGDALTVAQVPVKLGDILGNDVVVKDGLKPGERYVAAGIQKLRNGAPITPEKPDKAEKAETP